MKSNIYQIQISLKRFRPRIWRRILIPSDLSLADFHKVLQTTVGWTNSHLHQFIKNGQYYTRRFPDDGIWDELDSVDYENMVISDLLTKQKEKIVYEYDFGDSWQHEIILEKINPEGKEITDPVCITGRNNCPPEDCGGTWGYTELLAIIEQPDHEEYESMMEWLGGDYNPKYFNKDEINEMLKQPDFGCFEIFD